MMKKHIEKHKYLYLLILLVGLGYIIPIVFFRMPVGHDQGFHMNRIYSLSEELRALRIPARIYHGMLGNYGYASPLFYGNLLMYIPATLVVLFNLSIFRAYQIFLIVCVLLIALSMYICAKKIFRSDKVAFITASVYTFGTYTAVNIFFRHAIGEVQSFIFLPIVFLGIYNIIFDEGDYWYLLSLGMVGLILSHILTSVVMVVVLVLFCLIFIRKLWEKPKKFLQIVMAAVVFLLLASSFIFPMIEQMMFQTTFATDGTSAVMWGPLAKRSRTLIELFSTFSGQWVSGVGGVLLLLTGWYIVKWRKVKSHLLGLYLLFAYGFLFMTSRYFPWDSVQNYLATLQFPWRLLVFVTLFIALGTGTTLHLVENKEKEWHFLTVCIAIFTAFAFANTVHTPFETGLENRLENIPISIDFEKAIGGGGEYLPSNTDLEAIWARGDIVTSNESIDYQLERIGNGVRVTFSNNHRNDTYLDVPLLLYKGYVAEVSVDGEVTPLEISRGENNVVRVEVDNLESGQVTVWYRGTTIQHVTKFLSFSTLIVLIVYIVRTRMFRKSTRK